MVKPLWKTRRFLKKLKIKPPYDQVILLLGIYLENMKTLNLKRCMHPNVHSSTIYNSPDTKATQQMTRLRRWDTHTLAYYSPHRTCPLRQHEWSITLSEKSQRKTNAVWYHSKYGTQKIIQINPNINRNTKKINLWLPKGRGWGGKDKLGMWT